MEAKAYDQLCERLIGRCLDDRQLFMTAFTHRSYLNEHRRSAHEHNERLEFLGDAVLDLVVAEYLYQKYDQPEGILTNWRAALVRTETLAAAATEIGFSDYLRLSKGEQHGNDRAHDQIMANVFEAVVGAIYVDQGLATATDLINSYVINRLPAILKDGLWIDAKTKLQEYIQNRESLTPTYRVIEASGPDHDKNFRVGVYVGETMIGIGHGPSKQIAQKEAAEDALGKIEPEKVGPSPQLDSQSDKN